MDIKFSNRFIPSVNILEHTFKKYLHNYLLPLKSLSYIDGQKIFSFKIIYILSYFPPKKLY